MPQLPLLTIQLCFRHVQIIVAGTPRVSKTNVRLLSGLNGIVRLPDRPVLYVGVKRSRKAPVGRYYIKIDAPKRFPLMIQAIALPETNVTPTSHYFYNLLTFGPYLARKNRADINTLYSAY